MACLFLQTCRILGVGASSSSCSMRLPAPTPTDVARFARIDLSSALLLKGLPVRCGRQAHVLCRGRSLQLVRCRADGADIPLLDVAHDIDPEALAAEAPRLLALCRDLDFNSQISTLRQEARNGLQDLSLHAIHNYVDSWSQEILVQGLEQHWTAKLPLPESWWNVELAMQDLRLEACRQAVQQLAREVDSSFDWERAARDLQHHVRQQSPPGPFETMSSEQKLWDSWVKANDGMSVADNELMQDALAVSTELNGKEQLLHLRAGFQDLTKSITDLQTAAVATASIGASLNGLLVDGASAADNGLSIQPLPESVEAAARAPSWLAPAVLAFPVVTYLLFNYYREQVNPSAKVIDWMFAVMAAVIVANLVLIATLGVRLY